QIKRNDELSEVDSPLSRDEIRALMNYPGKLEEIGALMLAGKFSREEVYENFGEEILTCKKASFLWNGEDLHYWKVFRLLSHAMEDEHTSRDRLQRKTI